jgi:hypothetical protein
MDISAILTRKFPESRWSMNGESYQGLVWNGEGEPPNGYCSDFDTQV